MTPYWFDNAVALYLGDCREVLPALDVAADCIVADPPYGETSLPWDRWPEGWLEVAAEVTSSLWCFGSLRTFLTHRDEFGEAGWKLSQDVIWEKHNGSGFVADRFKRVHEAAVHWYQGDWRGVHHETPRAPYFGPNNSRQLTRRQKPAHTGEIGSGGYEYTNSRLATSVLRVRSMHGRAIHESEKPLGILDPLIRYACPPGGLVVDPFGGSGSTLDAARASGRRAIGVEAHEPYAEKAAS